jgi:hypothetical protein
MNRLAITVKFQIVGFRNNLNLRNHQKNHLLLNLAFNHKNRFKKIFHQKIFGKKNMINQYYLKKQNMKAS